MIYILITEHVTKNGSLCRGMLYALMTNRAEMTSQAPVALIIDSEKVSLFLIHAKHLRYFENKPEQE